MDPHQMDIELRIYQSDDVEIEIPETTDILQVMQKIREFDLIIEDMKQEEDSSWM
jgi:16S rRNA U1498 N3-methylase RsmE